MTLSIYFFNCFKIPRSSSFLSPIIKFSSPTREKLNKNLVVQSSYGPNVWKNLKVWVLYLSYRSSVGLADVLSRLKPAALLFPADSNSVRFANRAHNSSTCRKIEPVSCLIPSSTDLCYFTLESPLYLRHCRASECQFRFHWSSTTQKWC